MAFPVCQVHQIPQQIICYAGDCCTCHCPECFSQHHPDHELGVVLNEEAKECFMQWIQFMIEKIKQIKEKIMSKGYTCFFVMRLDSSFPRHLVCEISKNEIERSALKSLNEYQNMLERNRVLMDNCQNLEELNVEYFLKDLYEFFMQDTSRNLRFLIENLEKNLKEQCETKKIYEFIHFLFSNKELSLIQIQRKQLIRQVEAQVIFKMIDKDQPFSPIKTTEQIQSENLHEGHTLVDIGNFILNFTLNQISDPENCGQDGEAKPEEIEITGKVTLDKEEEINILRLQNQELRNKLQSAEEQLSMKQKSICQLNKLINNEQQELMFRQNESQILTLEIRKLLSHKEKAEEMEEELEKTKMVLDIREKGIKQLNNLISNEEEQLVFRERQIDDLMSDMKKIIKQKEEAEAQLKNLSEIEPQMMQKISCLSEQNQKLKQLLKRFKGYEDKEDVSGQLVTEFVQLEAKIESKNKDIKTLVYLVNELSEFVPNDKKNAFREKLSTLQTLKIKEVSN